MKLPALEVGAMSVLVDKLRVELAMRKNGNPGFVPFTTEELTFVSALLINHYMVRIGRRARRRKAA